MDSLLKVFTIDRKYDELEMFKLKLNLNKCHLGL